MQAHRWFGSLLLACALTAMPVAGTAQVSIGVSIGVAPPMLPVYEQPICPAPNYIWTPGYWAWGDYGYYWVPGTWIEPPAVGLLWTPGYWGWGSGAYAFHAGYWGPTVGFYGGVDYGFGYNGRGFYGGRWVGNSFSYNTAVVNVNRTVIRNTYIDRTVIVNRTANRVSFNGGHGGLAARPTAAQVQAEHGRRFGPIATQERQANLARETKVNYYSANHGAPPRAAMARPAANEADFNRARPARGANLAAAQRTAATVRPVAMNGKTAASGAKVAEHASPAARTETKSNERRGAEAEHVAPKTAARTATPERPTTATHSEARRPETAPRESRPAEPRTTTPAETRPETRPQARPETRTEARPETKTAPRPETRTEARPETKTAPRPETPQEPRPQARPVEPKSRPVPEERREPAPTPTPHRAPEPKPMPQQHAPAPRPEPQEHAAPRPQQHAEPAPRPEARPAAPRPAPPKSEPHPEEKPR